jgi:hypothetical protein
MNLPAFPKPGQQKRKPKYLDDDGVFRYPDGREVCKLDCKKGSDEYQRRKFVMWDRQGKRCALMITDICKQRQGRWPKDETQYDHEDGRGGGKQDDRIEVLDPETGKMKPQNGTVCPYCNSAKGSRKVPYIYIDTP